MRQIITMIYYRIYSENLKKKLKDILKSNMKYYKLQL